MLAALEGSLATLETTEAAPTEKGVAGDIPYLPRK
jgi:hypothetical protein